MLSLFLLKVNNWVERVVSLAVIFFSFLAKRPNDVTIFVLKMRNIAEQCSFCCGLLLVCSSSSLDRSARSVILQPVEQIAGSHIYSMRSKKRKAVRTHHRGLLRIDWWCRMDPARLEPLTSAPQKKKKLCST